MYSEVTSMANLTDKRMFLAVSSLATPDAHGPSHHEREEKPIGRRYRSIRSYAEGAFRVADQAMGVATPEARERRSFPAILTRSAMESARIFSMTLPRCAFTVISLMPSSLPTCLFGLPEATNAITWRSRPVSDP